MNKWFWLAFLFLESGLLYQAAHAKGWVPVLPWWGEREDKAAAKSLYGKSWRKALRTCRESHLPGDCPICGAK